MAPTRIPLITILMPVYNAAGYIAYAARSVMAGDHIDLELLVVDDGSTDAGMDELAALGDPRIRVVRQPNSGLIAALNTGLDEARGAYLARMDADDLSVPGRLTAQVRWLEERPTAVVCGTDYEMFGTMTGRVRMPRGDRACRERLLLASCHCGASVMMRRKVLARNGLRFDPKYPHAEDYEFFSRLAEHGELGNLQMVGYRYRTHSAQVSARHAEIQRATHLRVAAAYAERTGRRPVSEATIRQLMWPAPAPVIRTTMSTAAAAAAALRRRPGMETARFGGRRVVEATLNAVKD
ncbi:MAG: glycosyl transferase [Gordonia sp.]|jgi:glycosyltransferase involved in cell wall biosynthesis|nr:glycosyl transferase [Gordonia sp. (in: high G+C Gram-positive bacteria)]